MWKILMGMVHARSEKKLCEKVKVQGCLSYKCLANLEIQCNAYDIHQPTRLKFVVSSILNTLWFVVCLACHSFRYLVIAAIALTGNEQYFHEEIHNLFWTWRPFNTWRPSWLVLPILNQNIDLISMFQIVHTWRLTAVIVCSCFCSSGYTGMHCKSVDILYYLAIFYSPDLKPVLFSRILLWVDMVNLVFC